MSNNLSAPRLTGGQANPETTSNDADNALDAALTETLVVDLTNSATVTAANYQSAMRIKVTPSGVAKTLTLQAIKKLSVIDNQGTNNITVALGTANFTLAHGAQCFVYTDGTANGLLQLALGGGTGGGSGTDPMDLAVFVPGKPLGPSVVFRYNVVRAFTWPISLTGSTFNAGVAATGTSVFTIKQNGTSIGTLSYAAAGTVPTVTFASAVTFAVNDVITIEAPTTQDATLADIAFNFNGSRTHDDTILVPFDLNLFINGKPAATAKLLRFNVVRAFTLPASLTGSVANAGTASSASTVFTIKQNGASIGTITFSTSATGTLSFAASVTFAVNDVLTIESPAQDATLADVAFNLKGSR